MNVRTLSLVGALLLAGCNCPPDQQVQLQEAEARVASLEAQIKVLQAPSTTASSGTATASGTEQQLDQGTVVLWDKGLASLASCSALQSKGVLGNPKLSSLPVGVIVTHTAPAGKTAQELWITVQLDGKCGDRDYVITSSRSNGRKGLFPWMTDEVDPSKPDRYAELDLRHPINKAAILNVDINTKLLMSPSGGEANYGVPSKTDNNALCAAWTDQLKQMWTDTGGTKRVKNIQCITTTAGVTPCDGTETQCPDWT